MIARVFAAHFLCALYLCLSCAVVRAELSTAITACESSVIDEEDANFNRLADICPGLIAEIEASRWNGVLVPAWREDLSYWELSQLAYFDAYYSQQIAAGGGLSLAALDNIVAGLGKKVQQTENDSLWDKFVEWLKNLFAEGTAYSPDWLTDWLSKIRLPTSAIEMIFWVLCAIIIVAAIVVVVREIKATRQTSVAGETGDDERGLAAVVRYEDRMLTLKDVDEADLYEKPSLLLRLILQRLEKLGMITNQPAYTHREAQRAASLLQNSNAETFSRVSESAERIRFSAAERRDEETGQVVLAGIALLKNLKPERT